MVVLLCKNENTNALRKKQIQKAQHNNGSDQQWMLTMKRANYYYLHVE